MKRANPTNINTKTLWNGIYSDRDKYILEQTGKTKRFERTLEEVKNGDSFLDIGCGVGIMTKMVKDKYPKCEVWGTDISDKVVGENKKAHPGIFYVHQYIGDQTKLSDEYFDVVFSGETLEHLDHPDMLFKDAARVLKAGGKFIITTPLEENIQSPEHTWYFTQSDIEDLYLNNGFNNVKFVYLPDMEHLMVIYAIGIKI